MRTRGNVRPFFVAAAAARAAEAGDAKKALFGSQVGRRELHYTRITVKIDFLANSKATAGFHLSNFV